MISPNHDTAVQSLLLLAKRVPAERSKKRKATEDGKNGRPVVSHKIQRLFPVGNDDIAVAREGGGRISFALPVKEEETTQTTEGSPTAVGNKKTATVQKKKGSTPPKKHKPTSEKPVETPTPRVVEEFVWTDDYELLVEEKLEHLGLLSFDPEEEEQSITLPPLIDQQKRIKHYLVPMIESDLWPLSSTTPL